MDFVHKPFKGGVVFAVEVLNAGGPGGLILVAQIVFHDGSSETIRSNRDWKKVKAATPVDFMDPFVRDWRWDNVVLISPVGSWTATVPSI